MNKCQTCFNNNDKGGCGQHECLHCEQNVVHLIHLLELDIVWQKISKKYINRNIKTISNICNKIQRKQIDDIRFCYSCLFSTCKIATKIHSLCLYIFKRNQYPEDDEENIIEWIEISEAIKKLKKEKQRNDILICHFGTNEHQCQMSALAIKKKPQSQLQTQPQSPAQLQLQSNHNHKHNYQHQNTCNYNHNHNHNHQHQHNHNHLKVIKTI